MALVHEKRLALWTQFLASRDVYQITQSKPDLLPPPPSVLSSSSKREWEHSMWHYRDSVRLLLAYLRYKRCMEDLKDCLNPNVRQVWFMLLTSVVNFLLRSCMWSVCGHSRLRTSEHFGSSSFQMEAACVIQQKNRVFHDVQLFPWNCKQMHLRVLVYKCILVTPLVLCFQKLALKDATASSFDS